MAIEIGSNFKYSGKLPNFERDQFTTLQEMQNFPADSIDNGHISYCVEDGKHYTWNGTEWEELKTNIKHTIYPETGMTFDYDVYVLDIPEDYGTTSFPLTFGELTPNTCRNITLLVNNYSSDVVNLTLPNSSIYTIINGVTTGSLYVNQNNYAEYSLLIITDDVGNVTIRILGNIIN